ncbi:peptidoglycan D,D-transpeptidase FtsI family protein [Brevibacterium casei]|uniref:Cell division protein FtsI (Penicillin-binding protein 3) n=1 Tax=Brevibacterium casei CIP 102111 TaxID=1255625 RepID=A0A2H1I4C8_9MICO|nr:penicillin-binding protein 2 [Brevibacterium casei]QPR40741.1 penicillin-binding protein 2 [Brevibacterium casei]QPR44896.1 penicillin-binding protein 2 [Brevibacterium casei]QZE24706.1 penicillin-binding protein 2 [Brevibacterium casei]SMX69942.1 cell division protein FtsI (penicillin-binding protein 3) [Brevibacterium casei CIP 102111]
MAPRARKAKAPNLRRRIAVVAILSVIVLVVTGVRLVSIQGMDSMKLAEKALANRLVTRTLPADRGQIVAADGTVLADSVSRYQLVVDQKNVAQYKRDGKLLGAWGAAEALAGPLNTDPGLLYPELVGDKRWNPVAKGLTSETWREIEALDILGISAEEYAVRSYPSGGVAGNLVGFLSSDGQAQAGLELAYDEQLSGRDGQQQYERGARGDIIPLGDNNIRAAKDGDGIRTTINPPVQYYAQQAIAEQVKKHKAESGSVVIKEIKTGKILTAADAPSVDPNNPGKVDGTDRGSRIFTDVFEPGSTAKMVTAAALLDQGLVTPDQEFTVPDTWKAPNGEEFRDSSPHPDQKLTFAGILAESSNTGTILAGQALTEAQRYEYMKRFGFGSASGIGFPAETGGILHPYQDWDGRTKYTVMFGQGMAANAIQTTDVIATIANGGVDVPSRLVDGTISPSGRTIPLPADEPRRVVSEKAADQTLAMLEGVVAEGTGQSAQVSGYRVAGKTGTAQAPSAEGGGYDGYTASFVGVIPAEDPQFAISVTLQRPRKGYYGGTAAAPVFSDVAGFVMRHYKIPPSSTDPNLPAREWK